MNEPNKAPNEKVDICITLFTLSESEKVKNLFTYIDGEDQTIITAEYNPDKDDSYWDCMLRVILEKADIDFEESKLKVDDVYYLGDIKSKYFPEMKCFGINVSSIPDLENKLKNGSSKFHKIGFHHLVNGECNDALLMSSSFMLASYFA